MDFTKCPRKCCPKKVLKAPLYKCQFGTFLAAPWGVSPIDTNKKTLTCHYFRFQDREWGGKKAPLATSFSPVTCTTVGITPKTSWLLVLALFPYCCNISSLYLAPVTNYWTWTKTTPHPCPPPKKKRFLWSNPYKIEYMITSLTEKLELPNFGHMITSTI